MQKNRRGPYFSQFLQNLYNSIQKPPLVSEKNEDVLTENRKVRKIVAAAIFLRRIVKFVIACNPGQQWEIKSKEIRCSFVKQRIEPMSRNSRRPGPAGTKHRSQVTGHCFTNKESIPTTCKS